MGSSPIVTPLTNMKKVNRKMKERAFNKLKKTNNPFQRVDKFGKVIDFGEYGKDTDKGWLIVNKEAISIGSAYE